MTGIIHEVEQRTPEWHSLRSRCILTASEFGAYMIDQKTQKAKDARHKAILRSIRRDLAEFGTVPLDGWEAELSDKDEKMMGYNIAVQRGTALEESAVREFESIKGYEVSKCGFVTTECGNWGCSPDGLLIGAAGLEIKCPLPENHLAYLLAGEIPPQYIYQVYGSMAITGLPWVFMSHCPGCPPLIVEADDMGLVQQIRDGMAAMAAEKRRIADKLRKMWN